MNSSEKLLALYDELITSRNRSQKNRDNVSFQERYHSYKKFMDTVKERADKIKIGQSLNYDDDQDFLDHLFILNNPISTTGSTPISHDSLKRILKRDDFIKLVESMMLVPSEITWKNLRQEGKKIFKSESFYDQPLRFNRICAASTIDLAPIPTESNLNKLIKYLESQKILDFSGVEKNWFAQNAYLIKKVSEVFKKKIQDVHDFTDEYWLNLFVWTLYAEKVAIDNVDITLNNSKQGEKKLNNQLNRILFGAAGTGKTYNTINHALSILDPEILETHLERKDLKDRFDELKHQGRIKFVTFHQSFSYEDFVEGIRAESDGQGNLKYKVEAGVFKELCEQASGRFQQDNTIDNAIEKFLEDIAESPLVLKTQKNKKFTVNYLGNGLTIQCQPLSSESNATYYANIDQIKSLLSGEVVEKIYSRSYIKAIAEYLKPQIDFKSVINPSQPYVLIIDEINRGNISRIFGELITLIEDSKREGADEALSVTLPYSKKEFFVPKNVYIIGTMNSSDRSLTGLDIALRRRFTFIEMPPKPELLNNIEVEGLNIGDLLEVMNQRIEVLLDRDHCLGHANFMSFK